MAPVADDTVKNTCSIAYQLKSHGSKSRHSDVKIWQRQLVDVLIQNLNVEK